MQKFEGRVFRPPSEGRSLIIQATIGCSHNKCRFCTMYREKIFRIKSADEIIEELKELREYYGYYKRIFLADGDAMAMKTSELLKVLRFIKKEIPNINRVGIYAHGNNLLRKNLDELRELKANGLAIVYVGLESGSDKVLRSMKKGISVEETIKGCQKAKEAGIKTSIMIISGLGGKSLMREHAIDSARAVSRINPNYLSLLTLMVEDGSDIARDIKEKSFQLLDPYEVLEETKLFLEETDLEKTIFRSNHISNYISLEGVLGRDKKKLLEEVDELSNEDLYEGEIFRGL